MATARFGLWAAWAAFIAAVGYAIPQLLQVAGVLHDPWDRILIFAPSLALAPCFVLTMAALHEAAPAERRVFTLGALALAVMYGVLACIVYVTQLSVVIPGDLSGGNEAASLLACCGRGQFTTGLDLLGYTLMSLSTLCAAGATRRAARFWLIANGLLAPVLIGQLVWPGLIVAGAAWLVTFPAAMAALALGFRRMAAQPAN